MVATVFFLLVLACISLNLLILNLYSNVNKKKYRPKVVNIAPPNPIPNIIAPPPPFPVKRDQKIIFLGEINEKLI